MKVNHRKLFKALVESEGIEVKFKTQSTLMKMIGWFLTPINPTFMTGYTTTLGETIYFPSPAWLEASYERAWMVLCHELVHVEDHRTQGKLFSVRYSMPQGLAVLSLLGLVFHSWWCLLFLLFLAPWPAPWRMLSEMRGYGMSMAVDYWVYGGGISQAQKDHVVNQFTSSSYYWMYPFKKTVQREVGRWTKGILCDELQAHGPVFGRMKRLISANKL